MRKPVRYAVTAAVLAGALAACGGTSAPASAPSAAPAAPASSRPAAAAPGIGATLHVTGVDCGTTAVNVKLVKVTDPSAPDNSLDAASAGHRLIAVVLRITGASGTTSSDANNSAVLIGANGQTYQTAIGGVAGYTNFNSGDYTVSPGQSSVGAVAFQVPDGVKVSSVQFAGCQYSGTPATWKVR